MDTIYALIQQDSLTIVLDTTSSVIRLVSSSAPRHTLEGWSVLIAAVTVLLTALSLYLGTKHQMGVLREQIRCANEQISVLRLQTQLSARQLEADLFTKDLQRRLDRIMTETAEFLSVLHLSATGKTAEYAHRLVKSKCMIMLLFQQKTDKMNELENALATAINEAGSHQDAARLGSSYAYIAELIRELVISETETAAEHYGSFLACISSKQGVQNGKI